MPSCPRGSSVSVESPGIGHHFGGWLSTCTHITRSKPSHNGLASHSSVIAARECFDVGREGISIVSRKRKHQWTATLVPWGTLMANPNHRHFGKTREQRIDVAIAIIRQTLVDWLADFTVVEMPEVHLV